MKKTIALLSALALMATLTAATVREWTEKQTTAHEIAELARGMGLPEDDPIIVRAQELWWEDFVQTDEAEETPNTPCPVEPRGVDLYSGILPYEITYNADTEYLAVALAQTVYGEFRGGWSQTEQACIIWTVLNRVDAGMYSSVYSALTAPYQFAYNAYAPTYDDYGRDLTALARDVLYRWQLERSGQTDVGRVLPQGYCWYSGDGRHNYFRASYNGKGAIWFGLASPYES